MSATYTIKLPQFEGPFDLLLFFIERDELDIHDIPIAKITDEFLSYIRQMEALNIDLASEFILVAATLMRIKAKMLIPRKPIDEEGNEIDPREELVQRLLEYKRYKSVLEDMRAMEEKRSVRNERGGVTKELQQIATKALVDIELESLTLFKLLRAFERVLQRQEDKKAKAIHRVYNYNYSIQGQQVWLLTRVRHGQRADFTTIFGSCKDRIHAIVTFLALLELLNMQKLHCIPGMGVNNFWLEVKEPDLEEEKDVVDGDASEDIKAADEEE
ncbi:MAG: segregation/condensation protein A [Bacteroidota bacterium]